MRSSVMLLAMLAGVGARAGARVARTGRKFVAMVAIPDSADTSTAAEAAAAERHAALKRPLPSEAISFAREPTLIERRSIEERQLRHKASDLAAVPSQCQCADGFPQVRNRRTQRLTKPQRPAVSQAMARNILLSRSTQPSLRLWHLTYTPEP